MQQPGKHIAPELIGAEREKAARRRPEEVHVRGKDAQKAIRRAAVEEPYEILVAFGQDEIQGDPAGRAFPFTQPEADLRVALIASFQLVDGLRQALEIAVPHGQSVVPGGGLQNRPTALGRRFAACYDAQLRPAGHCLQRDGSHSPWGHHAVALAG